MRILVTDAHELAALGAIRSLGGAGHQVTAACPRRFGRPPAAWSRHGASLCISPDPWRSHTDFRAWLAEVLAGREFDAILPISEGATLALAALRPRAPAETLLLIPDDPSLEYSLSKVSATRRALAAGIACPPTVFVETDMDKVALERSLEGLRFPAIVKTDNSLTACGAYRKGTAEAVPTKAAALRLLEELARRPGRRMVQELIPGTGAGAFFLRWQGRFVLEFAHRRLHEVPYGGGMSSLRESVHDEALLAAGRRVLEALDYQGLAMVEFRRDASDGRLYFLEVNGRLWGSLALALHCGVDFPRALLACHQGQPPVAAATYPDGLRCRNFFPGEVAHLLSVLRAVPRPGMAPPPSKPRALGEFLALSLDPRVRHDHFWWSDPAPAAAMALDLGRRLARRLKKTILGPFRKLGEIMDDRLPCHMELIRRGFEPLPRQILFLCYGNICRSPFAEAYWNARRAEPGGAGLPLAASAGYYQEMGRATPAWIQDLAAEFGVDLAGHRSRMVSRSLVDDAGAIFVMDSENERIVRAMFPDALARTYYLGFFIGDGSMTLADPFLAEEDEARACYRRLAAALEGLREFMLSKPH